MGWFVGSVFGEDVVVEGITVASVPGERRDHVVRQEQPERWHYGAAGKAVAYSIGMP